MVIDVNIEKPKTVDVEIDGFKNIGDALFRPDYNENDPASKDYIQNRPFYSETVTEPLEITWDGFVGDKEYIVPGIGPFAYVRVSDCVPTSNELATATATMAVSVAQGVVEFNVRVEMFSSMGISGIGCFADEVGDLPVVIVTEKEQSFGGKSLSPGVWFVRIVEDVDNFPLTVYPASLYIPAYTYEKVRKLDNQFVDSEWMATESEESAEKTIRFLLSDESLILNDIAYLDGFFLKVDNRFYTEEELRRGAISFYAVGMAPQIPFYNIADASGDLPGGTVLVVADEALFDGFIAASVTQDIEFDDWLLRKGFYIGGRIFDLVDAGYVKEVAVRFLDIAGQTLPNKLPNKFLDLDWVPKMQTVTKSVFVDGMADVTGLSLGNYPALLDPETVLIVDLGGKRYEVLGATLFGSGAVYFYGNPMEGEVDFLIEVGENGDAFLMEPVNEHISISYRTRIADPMPREFLPDGVGKGVTIAINSRIEDGADRYIGEIKSAWESGSRVTLQFTNETVSLVSFSYNLDGMFALGVTASGKMFLFNALGRGNGWALDVMSTIDYEGSVLFKAKGDMEFKPTELNPTLTEGSQLPAQEGATYAAIQEVKNLITPLNEVLENRLNGGT